MERLLDINELSKLLSVKPSTIYGWIHEESVPYYKVNRLVRFSEKEIKEWLNTKRHRARTKKSFDI
jgi:excisionase family DNA binding protein